MGEELRHASFMMTVLLPPLAGSAQDETLELRPKFGEDGLLAAIIQDAGTDEVLMLAWMNEEALRQTLTSGRATFWSRSRGTIWVKGETSGHFQEVVDIRIDCDQDALLVRVRQVGSACHTHRRSCFYRRLSPQGLELIADAQAG